MSVEFEEPQESSISYRTVQVSFDHTNRPPLMIRALMKIGIKNQNHANSILIVIALIFLIASVAITYLYVFSGSSTTSRVLTDPQMYPVPKEVIKVPEYKAK
jgi:hypothetical protein